MRPILPTLTLFFSVFIVRMNIHRFIIVGLLILAAMIFDYSQFQTRSQIYQTLGTPPTFSNTYIEVWDHPKLMDDQILFCVDRATYNKSSKVLTLKFDDIIASAKIDNYDSLVTLFQKLLRLVDQANDKIIAVNNDISYYGSLTLSEIRKALCHYADWEEHINNYGKNGKKFY